MDGGGKSPKPPSLGKLEKSAEEQNSASDGGVPLLHGGRQVAGVMQPAREVAP